MQVNAVGRKGNKMFFGVAFNNTSSHKPQEMAPSTDKESYKRSIRIRLLLTQHERIQISAQPKPHKPLVCTEHHPWTKQICTMKPLAKFLTLVLLIHSYVKSEEITVAWNSSILGNKAVFTVKLGDEIIFQPCGVSQGTNVVYTNSESVFEDCIPRRNISSGAIYRNVTYVHVGDCVNQSGELRLSVNTETVGADEVFYLLSDYELECHNGLKAVAQVVPHLPTTAIPGRAVDPTPNSGKSDDEPVPPAVPNTVIVAQGLELDPTPPGESSEGAFEWLSVPVIIGICAVVVLISILLCLLLCLCVLCCCC